MSDKIRVVCPGCSTKLQLSATLRGSEITCPKCERRFQAGRKPDASGTPPANVMASKPVVARPVQGMPVQGMQVRGQPLQAQPVGEDFVGSGSSQPLDGDPFGAGPAGGSPYDNPYANPLPYSNPADQQNGWAVGGPAKKKTKQARGGAPQTDAEMQAQGSGIFLIFIPLIVTILPFFGLQLKKLASAGEYAPLGSMFAGFVGACLIAYGRRNQGDAVLGASGAVMATLVFGVGGFFLQKATIYNEPAPTAGSGTVGGGSAALSSDIGQRIQIAQKAHQQAMQDHDRRIQSLRDENDSSQGGLDSGFGLPDDSFGNPTGRSQAQSAMDSSVAGRSNPGNMRGDGLNSSHSASNNSASGFSNPADSDLRQTGPNMVQYMRRYGLASGPFQQARMNEKVFADDFEFVGLVGQRQKSGKLFSVEGGVEALCGTSVGPYLSMIPIMPSESQFNHAVLPEPGQKLVGVNLAFQSGKIVGFQGLFSVNPDGSQPVESSWIGKPTEDVQQSLSPPPGNVGYVWFEDGQGGTGFAWIRKK